MKRTRKLLVVALAIAIVAVFTSCDMFMPKHYYQAFVDQMKAMDFECMENQFYRMSDSQTDLFKSDMESLGKKGTCLLNYYNEPITNPGNLRVTDGTMWFDTGKYKIYQSASGWKIGISDTSEVSREFNSVKGSYGFKPEKPSDNLLKACKLIVSDTSNKSVSFVFDTEDDAMSFYNGYKQELIEQMKKQFQEYTRHYAEKKDSTDRMINLREDLNIAKATHTFGTTVCRIFESNIYGKYVVRVKVY